MWRRLLPRHRLNRTQATVLAAVSVNAIVALVIAGPWALAYAVLYVLATAPGWPIGFALFGRRQGAGWISGALIGYALTCLAMWAVLSVGRPSAATFALAWAAVTAGTWWGVRRRQPLVKLAGWTSAETRMLLLLLLLVPATFLFPYRNLGSVDAAGNRQYRAYFTADFVWHTALTSELTKYEMPPRNPYLGDRPMHYYWTYFLVPAVIAGEGPPALRDLELCLKANAFYSAVLFLGMLITITWQGAASRAATALAVVLAVLAASAEGAYAVWKLAAQGRSLAGLTDLNIDAMTAWDFGGLRIDSLVRSMWYNPQHSMSAALGLMTWPIACTAGVGASFGVILLAGLALAGSTIFNPLIGGVFSLIYGAVILFDALRSSRIRQLLNHCAAAVPVGMAIVWCVANEMVEGAGGVVVLGWGGLAAHAPLQTLLLSLGPLLLPALAGMWRPWRLPMRLWPAAAALMVSLVLFYCVRLSVESSYIGFRAGQILQLALAVPAASVFAGLWKGRRYVALGAVAVVLISVGLPTTVIDTFNAQDVGNRRMGPGFHWTVTVSPDEQAAFAWIRRQTPETAIVQMDPIAHGRETWSQVPTFAWRRMAAGQPISLMNIPEYEERSRTVHAMYIDADPEEAWRMARELKIDYIFIGPVERGVTPEAIAKFHSRPDFFQTVFANDTTRIFEVISAARR
jgi:hypothetical protein